MECGSCWSKHRIDPKTKIFPFCEKRLDWKPWHSLSSSLLSISFRSNWVSVTFLWSHIIIKRTQALSWKNRWSNFFQSFWGRGGKENQIGLPRDIFNTVIRQPFEELFFLFLFHLLFHLFSFVQRRNRLNIKNRIQQLEVLYNCLHEPRLRLPGCFLRDMKICCEIISRSCDGLQKARRLQFAMSATVGMAAEIL